MNTLIYILFYLITGFMFISYLFKEKLVVSYIDKFSDFFVERLKINKISLNDRVLYILNALFLLNIFILTLKINFSYDEILPVKNKVMLFTVIINFIIYKLYLFKRKT